MAAVGNVLGPNYLSKPTAVQNKGQITPHDAQVKFKKALGEALGNVNDLQVQADQTLQKIVKGEINDLHEVTISAQKALISLQTTVEIRNKVIDAYQEIMRMQV